MLFFFSTILTYFITMPGMYLIARSRLASSKVEVMSSGFFFGFALVVISYLGLSHFLPVRTIDIVVLASSAVCLFFLLKEFRIQRLPLWLSPKDHVQTILVVLSLLFMTTLAIGDLSSMVDDDFFIHGPNIKRISMGDIPPHMPYFPDSLLRGHVGRDLFTGTIGRFFQLTPELAIIYVTLAVCPAYIFVFHSLAWRLAGERRISTCFCFFGLLFLVSAAVGPYSIRAGSITYVWNNNAFAYSYAVFFGWLILRIVSKISDESSQVEASLLSRFLKHKTAIVICILAYASQYFIYISNFLMYSLFLVTLPFFALTSGKQRRHFWEALLIIGIVIAGALVVNLLVSPLLWERVLISLNLHHPTEPMGFMQQARLTFKTHLLRITDPSGADNRFFSRAFLFSQGLSFYIGLAGLLVGLVTRRINILALSLFGLIPLLWLLFVDMGEYRADTLRLVLLEHMGFGAATGLMIGVFIEEAFLWINVNWQGGIFSKKQMKIAGLSAAVLLTLWMAEGNASKFVKAKHYRVAHNMRNIVKIQNKNPEDWHPRLNMRRLDYEAFHIVESQTNRPDTRIMLKLAPANQFRGDGCPLNKIAQLVNCAAITGAGIAGVCQEHNPVGMGTAIFPYDYRASLFWQAPSAALLDQLHPDYLIIDPSIVEPKVLEGVLAIAGIARQYALADDCGRKRLILSNTRVLAKHKPGEPLAFVDQAEQLGTISFENRLVKTDRYGLANIDANMPPDAKSSLIQMQVIDQRDQLANVMDCPIIGITKLAGNKTRFHFSMIQTGHWKVYFVDALTGQRLHAKPINVVVSDKLAIGEHED